MLSFYAYNLSKLSFFCFYRSIDAGRTSGHICHFVYDSKHSNDVMMLKVLGNIERLCLFTKKNISIGEELLYDYGDKGGGIFGERKRNENLLLCTGILLT
jgi:hypothetical protein